MKPATVAALATALEQLAAVLREEGQDVPKARRLKLSLVAKEKGVPSSTLRELILSKEIDGVRFGKGRGHWLVDPEEVERYFTRKTSRARGSHLREVASH